MILLFYGWLNCHVDSSLLYTVSSNNVVDYHRSHTSKIENFVGVVKIVDLAIIVKIINKTG